MGNLGYNPTFGICYLHLSLVGAHLVLTILVDLVDWDPGCLKSISEKKMINSQNLMSSAFMTQFQQFFFVIVFLMVFPEDVPTSN